MMQKLLTGFAAAAAFVVFASAGYACDLHASHVSASIEKVEEGVAMSTYDGATAPTIQDVAIDTTAITDCPAGAVDCPPVQK
jgi:hypothetical protein